MNFETWDHTLEDVAQSGVYPLSIHYIKITTGSKALRIILNNEQLEKVAHKVRTSLQIIINASTAGAIGIMSSSSEEYINISTALKATSIIGMLQLVFLVCMLHCNNSFPAGEESKNRKIDYRKGFWLFLIGHLSCNEPSFEAVALFTALLTNYLYKLHDDSGLKLLDDVRSKLDAVQKSLRSTPTPQPSS